MSYLKKETKIEIYNIFKKENILDSILKKNVFLSFLESIWDISKLPSTDPRYKSLKEDIIQHFINNDDWDIDLLFLGKLSLLDDDEKFKSFIEKMVSPDLFDNLTQQENRIISLNKILESDYLELVIYDESENGFYRYIISSIKSAPASSEIPINTIPFFIDKNIWVDSRKPGSHTKPDVFPSFLLAVDHWDDFGVESQFDLFYYPSEESIVHIGAVKIIHKTELSYKELANKYYLSREYLPESFTNLSECCSLGQSKDYYNNIKKQFPDNYRSILWALQDAAIFSEIEDNFSQHNQFHSLIRENEAERLLRQEKYTIEGQDIKHKYQFTYSFTPKYSSDNICFEFKFDKESDLPNRIFAVIGENGVGKTQFITTLPHDIAARKSENFSPHIPLFSKIIAISNSYYDSFNIPKRTASFNYVYCGLSKLEKGKKEVLTPLAMKQRLHKACKDIQRKKRNDSLIKILKEILDADILKTLFTNNEEEKLEFNFDKISTICNTISSGQSALLYILCDVVSNIRYDSLLLFDEPETHLHPKAITTLMNAINVLLQEYESYCIIATHSPLVIRELLSRNVFIMERHGKFPSVRKIGLESFGENLTTLTEEIFGNKEVEKYYKNKLAELVRYGYSFEKITSLLQNQDIPLSLNLTMFIKNLISSLS